MKEHTLFSPLNKFLTGILDALDPWEKSEKNSDSIGDPLDRPERKEYFFYTQLIDPETRQVVGHLSDISSGGFKMDSQSPLPVNKIFHFCMNLSREIANQPFMEFAARSRWCQVDSNDPYVYNVGYQLVNMNPGDLEIFNRMMEKYGRDYDVRRVNLRRSNKW